MNSIRRKKIAQNTQAHRIYKRPFMFVLEGIRKFLWVLGLTASGPQLYSPEILVGSAITTLCSASLPA